MAKYRAIYTKIWADPDFQNYDTNGKLLFMYLCTNPYTTESGIYPITCKSIDNDIGIGLEMVNKLLSNGCLKNVFYDFDNKVVFVKKFRHYNAGGKPELIRISIINDHKTTKNTILWNEFLNEYPEYNDCITAIQGKLNGLETVNNQLSNTSISTDESTKGNLIGKDIGNGNGNGNGNVPLVNSYETVDTFNLYEKNIGPLTSIVCDELQIITTEYPKEWITEAIKESVLHGVRNLKYITKILETWRTKGYKKQVIKPTKKELKPLSELK